MKTSNMDALRAQLLAFRPGCEQEEQDRRLMLHDMDLFPDLLTRGNELAHFTASCWIVSRDRRQVLMAYHNIYQSWAWLGGHADGEADLLAVALREANEESGVTGSRPVTKEPISLEILTVNPHYKRGKFVSAHLHLNLTYLLEADETQPVHVKPDENSAVRWLPVEDICAAVSEPDMLPVYQKLLDRAKK